jgi:hypothetical protein
MLRKTLMAVVTILGAVLALAPRASAVSRSTPFSGRVAGDASFAAVDATTCPHTDLWIGGLQIRSEATGTAAHLGRVTMTAAHCAAFDSSIVGGQLTLTAANGDEIHVGYTGTCPYDPATAVIGETVITCHVMLDVTGGTGRFAAATGDAVMTAYITFEGSIFVNWPGIWTWTGRIAY